MKWLINRVSPKKKNKESKIRLRWLRVDVMKGVLGLVPLSGDGVFRTPLPFDYQSNVILIELQPGKPAAPRLI